MPTVNTVTGPIDTAELGFTLMHEHVFVGSTAMWRAYGDAWLNREEHVRYAVGEARSAKERGVRTIVDMTVANIGRDITLIREVAEKAEMQIIATTGMYWFEEPWLAAWQVDKLVDLLARDITHGIEGTDIKAGMIKAATDRPGLTETNKKMVRVAARLQRATGIPISTHTSVANRAGEAQQRIVEEEGVDLSRVIIGHSGDTEDLQYLESLLHKGSLLGMDRFGLDQILPAQRRVDVIAQLCQRGWTERIVLSHDACCYIDWYPHGHTAAARPNWNFRHICDDILPALRKAGITEEQITAMTIDNPRRLFERQGAY